MLNQTRKGFLLAPVALGVQLFLKWGVPYLIIPDIPIVSGIKTVIWSTVIVLDFLKLRYLIPYASNRLGITLIIFLQDAHALNKLCGYLEHFLEVVFLALLFWLTFWLCFSLSFLEILRYVERVHEQRTERALQGGPQRRYLQKLTRNFFNLLVHAGCRDGACSWSRDGVTE